MPKHCLMCGETHSGDCNPRSFVYFKTCVGVERMPFDAMAFGGFGNDDDPGIICACDKPARDCWESITYEQYKASLDAAKQ